MFVTVKCQLSFVGALDFPAVTAGNEKTARNHGKESNLLPTKIAFLLMFTGPFLSISVWFAFPLLEIPEKCIHSFAGRLHEIC